MKMITCIKQHLSNIWTSIHAKIKQHWGWVEKSVASKKSEIISQYFRKKVILDVRLSSQYASVLWSHERFVTISSTLAITLNISILETDQCWYNFINKTNH